MRTTKTFINAVEADLAKSNLNYSSIWSVAEKRSYVGKKVIKRYAALVYLFESENTSSVFRIYYNFDSSMGNRVGYTIRKTVENANEEFAKTLI